jgi:hypothetical protein
MPRNHPAPSFLVRGVPGGWRDCWDDPADSAALRAHAEASERRQRQLAELLGAVWRAHIAAETPARAPQRLHRPA